MAIWIRASRRRRDAIGMEAVAAVAAVLVFSTILSDHYVFWLFPWVAIAAAEGDSMVVVPTFLVLLLFLLIDVLRSLRPKRSGAPPPSAPDRAVVSQPVAR